MLYNQIDHHSLFEHVYTFSPIGIALVSTDGNWLKVNPALCKILGYSQEELTGLSFHDITHPDDLMANKDSFEQLLDGHSSTYETEKRYIRKNGDVIWTALHGSIVRDSAQGTPLYFISNIIDITEKKAAEQKLLEIESLYKLISENVQDIISYSSPDGITLFCSPSIRNLLGYEPEEIIGKPSYEYYHPDDLRELQSKHLSDHDVVTYRVRHKNGSYIWFETTYKVIRDDEGNIEYIMGIGRDVTERKRSEDILEEAQKIASLGSWEWNLAEDELWISRQVYLLCGLDNKKGEIPPQELLNVVHPSDKQRLLEGFASAKTGHDMNLEIRIQRDESIRFLHLRGLVSCDENGLPSKVNGTVQDITERKNVELELQESIQRYTSLKKYNHDAVFSIDPEGNIINTNEMGQKLTGYHVKDLVGVNFSRFLAADNLQRKISECAEDAHSDNNIDKIEHKDGHIVEVLTTIAPIIINSENVGYYIIAKDITEQRKLLIAKEAAESTNKAKSEFLTMMSHEIRTPMNGVIGMTDLLLDTTDLDPQQKEYVEIIRKSGDTLLTIINDILDFSKIESGKTDLFEEPFDVRECIAETLDVLSPKSFEKVLDMTFNVEPDVPVKLIGDSGRLRQVLINLVGNSIKFTYTGSIVVSVRKLSQHYNMVELEFVVKDTGIGIPADKVEHLFQPFYQLDNFMTRKSGTGTGLGLAISKKLVELMGGVIYAKSTDGPGATFVFTVRLKSETPEEAPQDEQLPPGSANQKPLKILIAEDNEINQLVLTKMLEKMGHQATVVENGQEVVQAIAYERYDIIFMDIQMPVMNGLEAAKIIKQVTPREKLPFIVAVTANALKGDREKYLTAGMDEYISKPLKSENVARMIDIVVKTR